MVPKIHTNKIWHSPINVYWHLDKLAQKVGQSAIETSGKYKSAREARIGAVVALALFKRTHKPTFLQLYKPDPPDVVLMQPSKSSLGTRDITQLEITSYLGKPKETLLEQLKRTKVPPGINLLSDNYILIVNLGIGINIKYEPIRDYLNENNTVFPVWTVQEKEAHPDTIAKVVIVNPEIYEMNINVGEAAAEFKKSGLPHVIRSKRAGSSKFLKAENAGPNYEAPWETIGK